MRGRTASWWVRCNSSSNAARVGGGSSAQVWADSCIRPARSSAERCATGERWPERPVDGSASALGSYGIVRWSAPLDLAGLSMRGYVAPAGPVLSATAWDDVLVTEAVSDDGVTLRLSVRPWGGRVERAELVFAQLRPGVTYVIDGAGAGKRGQQNGRQDADDGDHHQQFNQGESLFLHDFFLK